MDYLMTASQSRGLTVQQVADAERGVAECLAKLKADSPNSDHKSVIALNMYFQRLFSQHIPTPIPDKLTSGFYDKSLMSNNLFFVEGNTATLQEGLEPSLYVVIDATITDIVGHIEHTVSQYPRKIVPALVDLSQHKPEYVGDVPHISVLVFINSSSSEEHTFLADAVLTALPYVQIISEVSVSSRFDPSRHYEVSTDNFPASLLPELWHSPSNIKRLLNSSESRTPFMVRGTKEAAASVGQVLHLSEISGVVIEGDSSEHVALSRQIITKDWLVYDVSGEKTFMEFISNVFDSPSCVYIDTMVGLIGYIKGITVQVRCSEVETGIEKEIRINSKSLSRVKAYVGDIECPLYKNPRYTWNRLFLYNDILFSVSTVTVSVEVRCTDKYTQSWETRVITTSNASELWFISEHDFPTEYVRILRREPTLIPFKAHPLAPTFALRRLKLGQDVITKLGLNPDDHLLWSRTNNNLSTILSAIIDLVSLKTLLRSGAFNARHGFIYNHINVYLDRIEVTP